MRKLIAIPSDVTVDQPLTGEDRCRTCIHARARSRFATPEIKHAIAWGKAKAEDYMCFPHQETQVTGVYSIKPVEVPYKQTLEQTRLLSEKELLKLQEDSNIASVTQLVEVNSCGQQVAKKCLSCTNFRPLTTYVPWKAPGNKTRYRPIVLGGVCGLGPQGIMVNGQRITCTHDRKSVDTPQPSCWNCQFLGNPPDVLDEFNRDPIKVDLNKYEQWLARQAMAGSDSPGIVYNQFREMFCNNPESVYFTFGATIQDCIDGKYSVQFDQNKLQAWIDVDDPHIIVKPHGNGNATVEFHGLRFEQYNLQISVQKRVYLFPTPPQRYERYIPEEIKARFNSRCMACDAVRKIPCYSHARAMRADLDSGCYVFDDPGATIYHQRLNPQWDLTFDPDTLTVVDAEGNNPHPTIFKILLNDLIRLHPSNEHDIRKCYWSSLDGVPTRIRYRDVGWAMPQEAELWKRSCDHPNGLDFRKLFGDAFGSTREERDSSWAQKDEDEALFRAGITPGNPYEREFSVAKLQEELLLNDVAYTDNITPFKGFDTDPKIIRLDAFGHEIDLAIVDTEFIKQDRDRYATWLDENIEFDHIEVTVDPDTLIEVKHTTKVHVSNRNRMHGYDIGRYAKRGKATSKGGSPTTPNDVFRMHAVSTPFEPQQFFGEGGDMYRCMACDETFPFDQPELSYDNMQCPSCDQGELVVQDPDRRINYLPNKPSRDTKGLGLVILRERSWWLEQTRLINMECPNWVQRGSDPLRPITMRQTPPSEKWQNVEFKGVNYNKQRPRMAAENYWLTPMSHIPH